VATGRLLIRLTDSKASRPPRPRDVRGHTQGALKAQPRGRVSGSLASLMWLVKMIDPPLFSSMYQIRLVPTTTFTFVTFVQYISITLTRSLALLFLLLLALFVLFLFLLFC
jgi:hypothetical protein